MSIRWWVLAAALASGAAWAQEDLGVRLDQRIPEATTDIIFGQRASGFETPPAGTPANDAEASRFLTQATFGPNLVDIGELKSIGYQAWIDAQFGANPTLHRPDLEQQVAADVAVTPRNAQAYRAFRMERWFAVSLNAPDQLRQRMAYALSQILVISDIGALDNNPIGVAEYNDILLRNALGNYRNLLREVTLSPMMGIFLSSFRNQKTDWTLDGNNQPVPGLIAPDENYAREVMQLFSIGLIERNRDFSPILAGGQPVPTYSQDTITQTAKVMTGLAYACNAGPVQFGSITLTRNCANCVGTACNFNNTVYFGQPPRYAVPPIVTALIHPDGYRPMACYPRYADTGRFQTAANNYAVLPAPNNQKTLVGGVTVNPSSVPCHSGTPGADQQTCINYCNDQIETLITTLFMHPNAAPFMARQLIQRLTTSNPSPAYIDRVAAVFENDGTGARGNLGAVARAILTDSEARNPPAANFGKLREPLLKVTALWRAFSAQPGSNGQYGLVAPERFLAQRPLGAPSVFNFYEPDYQQPGEIASANLYSPEFQILDESTSISTSDQLWARLFAGYSAPNATTTNFAVPANAAYLPPSELDNLPAAHADLVQALNVRLMYGAMSPAMQGKLIALLDSGNAGSTTRRKALNLIHLIAISPEFAVQR